MSATDVEQANQDVPPIGEQENPTIFTGDIEAANENVPPIGEQGSKTELGDSLHPRCVTFGIAYSQYATDGAGHGPDYFAGVAAEDEGDEAPVPPRPPRGRAATKK